MEDDQKLKKIEEIFGVDEMVRVKKRHCGGISGSKGPRYEDFFAVYQLARLARLYIEEDKDCTILGQAIAFVDDLEICFQHLRHQENYQLKNSLGVRWEGEDRIAKDGSGPNTIDELVC